MARTRRAFGTVERLSSGRCRAAYVGPDAVRYEAPDTFAKRGDAEGWLASAQRQIDLDTWAPPTAVATAKKAKTLTLREYAETFSAERPVKPSTRALYARLFRN